MFNVSTRGVQNQLDSISSQPDALPVKQSDARSDLRHVPITILGAGFSGIGMAIRLKQDGYDDFVIIEESNDVGGNWRDNTYPGATCNISVHIYSFSYALNPDWSNIYPPQSEIHSYLRRCAERFDVIRHIRWKTELLRAEWQEEEQVWLITTTEGQFTTNIFVTGQGQLHEIALPNIPGLKDFKGKLFHSAQWDHSYELSGKRVAVIGSGATAIQFIPQIQPKVKDLLVFQRTASWVVPMDKIDIPPETRELYRKYPIIQRFVRFKTFIRNEIPATKLFRSNPRVQGMGYKIAERHLMEKVSDPVLREKLMPKGPGGCSPLLHSSTFYPALTQPNVEVITERVQEIREHSLVTSDGQEYEVDAIILATGFYTTEAQYLRNVIGRNGQTLYQAQEKFPSAYLGATMSGFPNLFWICGPSTSNGSMIYITECQANYVADCLRVMRRKGIQSVEVTAEAHTKYNDEILRRAGEDTNVEWKIKNCANFINKGYIPAWPGSTLEFRNRTRRMKLSDYHILRKNAVPSGQIGQEKPSYASTLK